ncbi:serine/threonine-protein kinase [Streptomyces phaeofaciens]|uniref:serine/threonine-protein kinase n=1 Tax=Streptomyces phaeofaciens TaxID=68254 RepID=UPI0036A079B2
MDNEDTVSVEPDRSRTVAGRYRLLSRLGEGGMGTVWRAQDEVLHREVAVKEVRAPAGLSRADIERMYTRLEREAWAAARITHPNVVTVHDVATDDGRPWIVMELVRGRSLGDLLRGGPLPPGRAAEIGAEVLSALRAAHAVGVLHRDVKPGNVLLSDDGRVVLTDFGIATVEGDSSLTMTGEVVGSPEYLPPERALGRTPGPASDLWSLGVLLYAAVEGISPYRQDTPLSTLRAIVDDDLPPARRAGPLGSVIEGLLRKDPAERTAAERTEQALRLVASGGTPAAGPSTASDTPTALDTASAVDLPTADDTPTAVDPVAARDTPTAVAPATASDTPNADDTPTADDIPTAVDAPAVARSATVVDRPAADDPTLARPATAGDTPATVPPAALPSAAVQPVPTHPAQFAEPTPHAPPAPPAPRRNRRASALLIAGTVACVLAAAGLGYALTDHGDDGTTGAGTTGTDSPSATTSDGPSSAEDGASPAAAGSQGQQDQDASASQTTHLTVTGAHTTYVGVCPPPAGQAPTFTVTFAVDQVPTEITYRWVSKDGSVVDREWRKVTFPEGGDRTAQDTVRLTTYSRAGTLRSEIGVEVKDSLRTSSNTVPFSVTCEDEGA